MDYTEWEKQYIANIPIKYVGLFKRAYAGKASPRQAIKANCYECVGFDRNAIYDCNITICPLYRYRPKRRAHVPDTATLSKERAGGVHPAGSRQETLIISG